MTLMSYLGWLALVFFALGSVFVAADWVALRWERREKERWDKAFGGASGARVEKGRDV